MGSNDIGVSPTNTFKFHFESDSLCFLYDRQNLIIYSVFISLNTKVLPSKKDTVCDVAFFVLIMQLSTRAKAFEKDFAIQKNLLII